MDNLGDISKIWERLEDRYGNTIEIVNVALQGIQQFQFSKNYNESHQGIVKPIDELDRGFQDLEAIDPKHEIANAYTERILEGKLPVKVLTRWHNKEIDESDEESDNVSVISGGSSKSSDQRFESLFKFLLRERKNAEKILLLKNSGSKTPSESQGRRKDINGHIGGGKCGSGSGGGGNS